jgi:hypothetical protein
MSGGAANLRSSSEQDAFQSVGVMRHRLSSGYEHVPLCALAVNRNLVMRLVYQGKTPRERCGLENVGMNQNNLYDVHVIPNPPDGQIRISIVLSKARGTRAFLSDTGNRMGTM